MPAILKSRGHFAITTLLLIALASSLAAQRRPAPRFVVTPATPAAPSVGRGTVPDSLQGAVLGRLLAGGIVGGVLGAGAGAAAGALAGTGRTCGDDRCSLVLGIYGFAAGEAIGLPLGVHLAGGRRGIYPVEFFLSAAAGALATVAFYREGPAVAGVAIPLSQLVVAIPLENSLHW